MRTTTGTSTRQTTINTGKIWTSQQRKVIKALTQKNASAKLTATRLQSLLKGFRTRARKLGASLTTKSSNGRNKRYS